jgi:hypothetical protein
MDGLSSKFSDANLDEMERFVKQNLPALPSLLSVSGVPIPIIGNIFSAALDFYRLRPWNIFQDETPLVIRCPKDDSVRYAVIMGAAGETYGISIYDSLADLQRMYQSPDPTNLIQDINWLTLVYDDASLIAPADREAIDLHHWPVDNEKAYPGIARVGSPGIDFYPPTQEDLFWLEGALPALNEYCRELGASVPHEPAPLLPVLSVRTFLGSKEFYINLLNTSDDELPPGK